MSTQDDITDALTRHQIFVLRYAKGRENDAAEFIAKQMFEVIERLESGRLTEFGAARAEAQLRDLYQYLMAANKDYADDFKAEMSRFAEYEASFNGRVLQQNIEFNMSLPSPIQIQQAAFGSVMSLEPAKGYTIGSLIDGFGPANAQFVVDKIRAGVTLGDTTETIIGEMQSLIPLQQRKASTVARTVTNHVSNQARKETLKENDDVLLGYEWVATLDSRTSLVCMARDGVVYKSWDNDPKPPAHFNCRSTITPKVNPEFDLGADIKSTRPSKGADGVQQVDTDTTYNDWLQRQPKAFQDEVLGKERAALFRKGMTLDKFVDARGRIVTISELQQLDDRYNGTGNSVDDVLAALDSMPSAEDIERERRRALTTFSKPAKPIGEVTVTPIDDIKLKNADDARVRLKAWADNNGKDGRWYGRARFRGRRNQAETDFIDQMPDDICIALESCLDDLDRMADAFNIPRLRGFVKSNANADMGDGIMGIGVRPLGARVADIRQGGPFNRDPSTVAQWERKTRKSHGKREWMMGRPWSVAEYLDNGYDRFRSTIFHEMAHHVHQMYVKAGEPRFDGWGLPPVEALLEKKRGKYTTAKRHSPSRYGDTNQAEWFAENFSAYYMGNKAKVDPLFLQLLEDLLRGAYV